MHACWFGWLPQPWAEALYWLIVVGNVLTADIPKRRDILLAYVKFVCVVWQVQANGLTTIFFFFFPLVLGCLLAKSDTINL